VPRTPSTPRAPPWRTPARRRRCNPPITAPSSCNLPSAFRPLTVLRLVYPAARSSHRPNQGAPLPVLRQPCATRAADAGEGSPPPRVRDRQYGSHYAARRARRSTVPEGDPLPGGKANAPPMPETSPPQPRRARPPSACSSWPMAAPTSSTMSAPTCSTVRKPTSQPPTISSTRSPSGTPRSAAVRRSGTHETAQAAALQRGLDDALPGRFAVSVGMRHWHPSSRTFWPR
jgi:hypothetical protein